MPGRPQEPELLHDLTAVRGSGLFIPFLPCFLCLTYPNSFLLLQQQLPLKLLLILLLALAPQP